MIKRDILFLKYITLLFAHPCNKICLCPMWVCTAWLPHHGSQGGALGPVALAFVRNAIIEPHLKLTDSEIWGWDLYGSVLTSPSSSPRWFWCKLNIKNHYLETKNLRLLCRFLTHLLQTLFQSLKWEDTPPAQGQVYFYLSHLKHSSKEHSQSPQLVFYYPNPLFLEGEAWSWRP